MCRTGDTDTKCYDLQTILDAVRTAGLLLRMIAEPGAELHSNLLLRSEKTRWSRRTRLLFKHIRTMSGSVDVDSRQRVI